jgi:steroid 5-alpha reductase family enzyme
VLALVVINAVVLLVFFVVVGAICIRIRDVTPVDAAWASGMVLLAISSALVADGLAARRALLTGLCAAWGVRLAAHLLVRWRRHGPDRRYVAIIGRAQERRGWSFARTAALLVFAVQAPLLFVVCLPVQLGQLDRSPDLGALAIAGAVIAFAGIAFETIGDLQLTRFRADPDNAGSVMDRGLWRYTRHPNYFGDACTWWGLFLIAAETSSGRWALPGPLLLTWTLTRWSGKPILESKLRRTRPGYAAYVERTPSFVPWFPKKEVRPDG